MKALKAFIKPFEAPQRKVKIKIWLFSFRPRLGREGLIQFNFSFKKETEMEDGQEEPLQLISMEIIFNIRGWVMFMFFVIT